MAIEDKFGLVVDYTLILGVPIMAAATAWHGTRIARGLRWKKSLADHVLRVVMTTLGAVLGHIVVTNTDLALPATDYAPGYARWRFNSIRVGDNEARVRDLVGIPLRVHEYDSGTVHYYSWPKTSRPPGQGNYLQNHWERRITLDPETKLVVEVNSRFRYQWD